MPGTFGSNKPAKHWRVFFLYPLRVPILVMERWERMGRDHKNFWSGEAKHDYSNKLCECNSTIKK